MRKPIVWGRPASFSVEPTNFCNLKCPECPSGLGRLTRPLGLLDLDEFKKLIDEIKEHAFYIQLFFQGEPYINKRLPEMIQYAAENNVYVSISTNGLLIDEKKVEKVLDNPPDKLIFSIDGLNEETYQNYRVGGTFAKADAGLRLLLQRKRERGLSKPFVELQFIVMKANEKQISDVLNYGKELGVNKTALKTMQVYSYENALQYLPENPKYRRYILKDGEVIMKGKMKDHCFALWRTSVITWDGKVVPCCFDKDAHYVLGSLKETKFTDIWKSEPYNKFRALI
ncbi:MAG TPA: radical SAM protein, partial [Ignavibacteriales bacterium]|nr:radical SAM protein [Ignavibacteriales bacterium]